jgi:hypothetical protein
MAQSLNCQKLKTLPFRIMNSCCTVRLSYSYAFISNSKQLSQKSPFDHLIHVDGPKF